MTRRHRLDDIVPVIFVVLALTCTGHAQDKVVSSKDLTCQVQGGSFVLDEIDFKALTQEKLGEYKVSQERFASLPPTSPLRIAVCETRKIWRLSKDGKLTADDLERYKHISSGYFTEAERNGFLREIGGVRPHVAMMRIEPRSTLAVQQGLAGAA